MIMNNCEKLLSEQISKLDKKISDLQLIRRSVCEFIKGLSLNRYQHFKQDTTVTI